MATMSALYRVAAITILLKVTSAQWESSGVPDMVAYTGKVFFVSFTSHPVYGDLAVNVKISGALSSDALRLASWLSFNSTTRSISGVPLSQDQGWTLLTIKTECAIVKTSISNGSVDCHKFIDVFKLTVLQFSWADFLHPSSELPAVSPTEVLYYKSAVSEDPTLGENVCDEDRVIASLILCACLEEMSSAERLELVTHLSDFLSIPASSIVLESSPSYSLKVVEKGFHIFYAGPGSGESCNLKENIEIIWSLPCSAVKHLTDFVKVLQHNVDGGRFRREVNVEIVGWYVASSNSLLTRRTRRRRRSSPRTIVPTPVLSPLTPTTVLVTDFDDDEDNSGELTSPVLQFSSSRIVFTSAIDTDEPNLIVFPPPMLPADVIVPIATDTMESLFSPAESSVMIDLSSQILDHQLTSLSSLAAQHYLETQLPKYLTTPYLSAEQVFITKTRVTYLDGFQTSIATSSFQRLDTTFSTLVPHVKATMINEIKHSSPSSLLSSDYQLVSSLSLVSSTDSIYMVTSRAVEVVAILASTTEPNIDEESKSHFVMSPSITTSFSTSSLVYEASDNYIDFSIETVGSGPTFGSPRSEAGYSSMSISLSLLEQEMSQQSTTISTEGTELSISDDGSGQETKLTLTQRVEIDETLFEGDYTGVSFIDEPVMTSTDVFHPTQSMGTDIDATVWTTIPSTSEADIENATIETGGEDSMRKLENDILHVQNSVGRIVAETGRLLEFDISHVFSKVKDGNTSSLTLSLELPFSQEVPSDLWLYLDSERQMLRGLPLRRDKSLTVLLVARHSTGLTVNDSIEVQITNVPHEHFTHVFIIIFELDYQKFMLNRRNLIDLIARIGNYFDKNGANSMTVLNVEAGSLRIFWTNNTLTGTICPLDDIKHLYSRMERPSGIIVSSFYRYFKPEYKMTDVQWEPQNACNNTITTTTTTTIKNPLSETKKGYDLSVWAHIILPVMIAVLVFVFIILIIIFCNRRHRHRQAILNAEKEAVSNDRNPIIFPDELEIDDPSLKAKDPLVLPTDPQLANQSVSQDSSSTKRSNSQEETKSQNHEQTKRRDQVLPRSQSQGEQDWRGRDRQIREVQTNEDPNRQKKESKRQKDQGRMGGSNTSSTLSCDRPGNHYLEEEEGSKSSTLKSTKSLGAEKRHPKSPPPYWQSHSDPPPYRPPPPYLTDITQV